MEPRAVFGAIEGGGTKFVCMVGTSPTDIVDLIEIKTTEPVETLGAVVEFLARPRSGTRLAAIGFSCFGPVGLDPASPEYGCVLDTPKPHWSGARVLAPLRRRFDLPLGFDHDVGGAVLAETRWGAAVGVDPVVYITVGTGIGGGAFVNGSTVHGLLHPEMGHLPVTVLAGDDFGGDCSFHGRCLEGMVSGPALVKRAGRPLADVPPDDPLWDLAAQYLAQGLASIVYTLSPRRIVLGGGVMRQSRLLPKIQEFFLKTIKDYLPIPDVESYVVLSPLDQKAGLYGALVLAERAMGTR